jgi:Zn-dependent peptidase ImmA (M78 family)
MIVELTDDLDGGQADETVNFALDGQQYEIDPTWVIVLNAAEPYVRQLFSLAHEFKHIVDHRFVDVIYPDLPRLSSQQRAEIVCDYFAGCLLVPKKWLRTAWTSGMQTEPELAKLFNVSPEATRTRLSQTGLIPRTSRCQGLPGRYHRFPATPLLSEATA